MLECWSHFSSNDNIAQMHNMSDLLGVACKVDIQNWRLSPAQLPLKADNPDCECKTLKIARQTLFNV